MIWKAKSKKRPFYKGLDCSGENVVMPPTFCGINELIRRAGSPEAAAALYPDKNEDFEGADTVRDFLQELELTDKVERQGLIEEFQEYVKSLEEHFNETVPGITPEDQVKVTVPPESVEPQEPSKS